MHVNRLLAHFKKNLAVILLLVFFVSEAYSKYEIFFFGSTSVIPRSIKFAVLMFLGLAILIKKPKQLLLPLLLFFFFILGQWTIDDGFNTEIVVSFSKFLFPVLLFFYFTGRVADFSARQFLFKTFEILIIANSFLIIAGLIFDITLFKTYLYSRFGYNGLFISSSTGSYVYCLALFFFLIKHKAGFLKSWTVWLMVLACIIMGTKAVYLTLLLTFFLFLIYYAKISELSKKTVLLGLSAIAMVVAYFFFFHFGIFNEIRQDKGLLTAIFSLRDELLLERTLPFIESQWSWPNYLFGGISNLLSRSQIGIIDVFYFWGLVGGLFFLYLFYKSYFVFPVKDAALWFFLIFGFIVFLAGNFFENASVAIYLLVLREKILKNNAA